MLPIISTSCNGTTDDVCQRMDSTVSTRRHNLDDTEIQKAFAEGTNSHIPVILSPGQLAELFGISPKTIYEWIAKGRLDGSFRKRGKHVLIWRDRAIATIFNGKDWQA